MKLSRVFAAIALCVGFASARPAAADNRAAVLAAYDRAAKAFDRKDFKTLFSLCTPDCVFVENGKSQPATEAKKEMEKQLAVMSNMHTSYKIESYKETGKSAVFVSHERTSAQMKGAKPGKFVMDAKYRYTVTKTAKGWLLSKSEALEEKATLDGKPVPTGQ